MAPNARSLEGLSRDELIARARKLDVSRPELLTRVELTDEIVRVSHADSTTRTRARGWLGVARDLLASAVESRLDLPAAAKLIRGDLDLSEDASQPPIATVTLAEIYAAQGHHDRAISMLDQVLAKEADHASARRLRDRLRDEIDRDAAPPPSRQPSGGTPASPQPDEVKSAPSDGAAGDVAVPKPIDAEGKRPSALSVDPTSVRDAVDAVVLVRLDALSTYVYWEVRPSTLSRARARRPRGGAVVRVLTMQPHVDGARRIERSVTVDSLQGSTVVDGFGENAVVRAVVGWEYPSGFVVFAVAAELEARSDSRVAVRWAPRNHLEIHPGKPVHAHYLRALASLREVARRSRRPLS